MRDAEATWRLSTVASLSVYAVEGRGTFYTNADGRVDYVETHYGNEGSVRLNYDLMNPQPNVTYVVTPDVTLPNGSKAEVGQGYDHVFVTDAQARTERMYVENLMPGDASRSSSVQGRVGREGTSFFGVPYEGGHLLQNWGGGGAEDINMAAMLREVNGNYEGSFGQLEGALRSHVIGDGGVPGSVMLDVCPVFGADHPTVPELFEVRWQVDGGVVERVPFWNRN
ncbi:hypothetical protein [Mycetocola reblochoni]|uniref:hypothetical protein n=1 Tax=Mycetocola reblochoni TaxID=331618 RepID=UPI003F9558DB